MNPIATLYWSTRRWEKNVILTSVLTAAVALGSILTSIGFKHKAPVVQTKVVTVERIKTIHEWHGIEVESPIIADPYVAASMEQWKVEVARRFPNAFVYALHGTSIMGQWICQNPDDPWDLTKAIPVKELALKLRAKYPDRVIVLLCCNPGHHNLGVPGVYHAMDSVWFVPDKWADGNQRLDDIDFVGNIYEFNDN